MSRPRPRWRRPPSQLLLGRHQLLGALALWGLSLIGAGAGGYWLGAQAPAVEAPQALAGAAGGNGAAQKTDPLGAPRPGPAARSGLAAARGSAPADGAPGAPPNVGVAPSDPAPAGASTHAGAAAADAAVAPSGDLAPAPAAPRPPPAPDPDRAARDGEAVGAVDAEAPRAGASTGAGASAPPGATPKPGSPTPAAEGGASAPSGATPKPGSPTPAAEGGASATAPPAEEAPAAAPLPRSGFGLQLRAFPDRAQAERFLRQWAEALDAAPSFIQEIEVRGGERWFRVRHGRWPNRRGAAARLKRLPRTLRSAGIIVEYR